MRKIDKKELIQVQAIKNQIDAGIEGSDKKIIYKTTFYLQETL